MSDNTRGGPWFVLLLSRCNFFFFFFLQYFSLAYAAMASRQLWLEYSKRININYSTSQISRYYGEFPGVTTSFVPVWHSSTNPVALGLPPVNLMCMNT